MNINNIVEIIKVAFCEVADVNEIEIPAYINEKTPLYGKTGYLDSIALVTLIVTIEGKLAEQGKNITIASEKSFSRRVSPFLTVETLAKFIRKLINEK